MQIKVMQVHHYEYNNIVGGVDRVVTELANGFMQGEVVLFEVGGWNDRKLSHRLENGISIYRR